MGKYLKSFENESAYNSAKGNLAKPNVAYDSNKVYYDKKPVAN